MKTQKTKINKVEEGFTLIELLVVIGILAVLLAITLIAINPARQFGQARNTQRRSAVTQILNAIGAYHADHSGNLPPSIASATVSATPVDITGANFPTLCDHLVTEYMPAMPADPNLSPSEVLESDCAAATWDTGYRVSKDANNRVTIYAPNAENGETIEVTR